MYDIVIAGSHITAVAFLSFMKEVPLSIAVIKTKEEGVFPPFTLLSEKTYQWIGAPKPAAAAFHLTIKEGDSQVSIDHQEIMEPALFYTMKTQDIQTALEASVQNHPAITWLQVDPIEDIRYTENGLDLQCGKEVIQTKLLVGADGFHSKVRELIYMSTPANIPQCYSLTALIKQQQPHQSGALQSWKHQSVCFFYPSTEAHESWIRIIDKSPIETSSAFLKSLPFFEDLTQAKHIHTQEVSWFHSKEYIQPHVVILGEAAHMIYAEELNMRFSIEDAYHLAQNLKAAYYHQTWYNPQLLKQYEKSRKLNQCLKMYYLKMIHQYFSLLPVRKPTILMLNKLSFVKKKLLTYALF